MSKSLKFTSFESYQPVSNMNQTVRNQQYAFNGRIFLPQQENFDSNTSVGSEYTYRNNNDGLIQMSTGESVKQYELYKDSGKRQDTNTNIISNIVVPNALSYSFFSNDNVDIIQRQIIDTVYAQSQKQIGKQSYQELQIIMKSIYLQYGRNLKDNIYEQVHTLNKYVIDECTRIIIPNVLQYNKYIDDITSPIPVMPRSQNVSNKGFKFGDFSSLIPSTNN